MDTQEKVSKAMFEIEHVNAKFAIAFVLFELRIITFPSDIEFLLEIIWKKSIKVMSFNGAFHQIEHQNGKEYSTFSCLFVISFP